MSKMLQHSFSSALKTKKNFRALKMILTQPKNALVKQYKKLLEMDNVELEFDYAALEAVADKAIKMKIGARGLRAVMEETMMDTMFNVPSDPDIEKVIVTADSVWGKDKPVIIKKQTES